MGGTIELGTAAGSAPATLLDLAGRPLTTDASKGSAFVTLVGNDGNPIDATHPVSTVAGAGTPGTANTANFGPDNADDEAVTTTNLDQLVKSRGYVFDGAGGEWDRIRALGNLADGAGVQLASQPSSTPVAQTSAANAANAVTIVPGGALRVRLTFLTLSQGGAAVVQATVSDGTTTLTIPVPANNVLTQVQLPAGGLKFAAGATVTITIPTAGIGNTSQINAGSLVA